jgi:hypothetical protein
VTFGARFAPTDVYSVTLDVRYQLWGLAPDGARQPFNVSIDGGTGLLNVATSQTGQPSLAFSSIFVPTLAGEYAWFDHQLTARAAYTFRPTYLQRPNEEEDLLDVNAHIVAAGLSWRWKDPVHLFPNGLIVDLAFQAQILPTAKIARAETSPIGTLTYGGAVVTGGAGLRMEL